ncbi:MAG: SPOR domain-containing protein [Deltaproteobacteria bacterium]|nr:SPOR domain-containing protein [Candidatus Tharpella sp.]
MFEQLKAALVTFLVIFVFFVGGILVGLKLPETEVYKQWAGIQQEVPEKLQPTKVAVIQIPGSQPSPVVYPEACPGGVCKLPEPGATSHLAAVAVPQESLDLTFYKELADKPTESGGSALIVKQTPIVKKRKTRSMTAVKEKKPVSGSDLWELRICSLPQEIKARLERSKLIKDFPGVKIEPVEVAGKGTWYRIKICDIKDRDTAERYQRELSRKYHYKPLLRQQ